jgi:hypothetical protein
LARRELTSSSDLIRWGGLAAIWGGVLWALWNAGLEFVIGWGEPPSPAYERYEAYNRVMPVILLLLVAGLLGFYAAQKGGGHGWLGSASLIIALIGFTLLFVGNVAEFWVFNAQPYGEANGRDNSWTLYLLGVLTLAIGSVLFGIATLRIKILPHRAAMLFTVGSAAAVVPGFGMLLFGTGWAWLGYALWSRKGASV